MTKMSFKLYTCELELTIYLNFHQPVQVQHTQISYICHKLPELIIVHPDQTKLQPFWANDFPPLHEPAKSSMSVSVFVS